MVAFCALADPQADANEVYATPLWAMLGWFEPGDIDAWAGQRGKVLLWMYVMVSNVLLVNLLIAMMGDTYAHPNPNPNPNPNTNTNTNPNRVRRSRLRARPSCPLLTPPG